MCSILTGVAKYLIFFFNFLIFLGSILLIVFGVLLKNDEEIGIESFDNLSISNLSIALGVLVCLISFFGCCGAIRENSCLLTTYAAILLTLFVIQMVLCILAFVAIKNGDLEFDDKIKEYVQKLFDDNSVDAKNGFADLQKALECCGVKSVNDYLGKPLPSSCCSGLSKNEVCGINPSKVHTIGCFPALKDKIVTNSKVIGGIAVGFGVIELVAAIFALYVRSSFK